MAIILGIETSCDETAVAILEGNSNKGELLSHLVLSQIEIHKEFGGVVPEVAARSHIDVLDKLIEKALQEAGITLNDVDAIAVTGGPGLIGGVIVGVMTAKALASVTKKPFIAINHLEGHSLTSRLTDYTNFPYLLLLVSGGHCQILLANDIGNYEKLGETIDDALGEAFDKVAQMLGLQYPGGPKVEQYAKSGDAHRFKFAKPLIGGRSGKDKSGQKSNSCNFSFSGLKTAVRREIEKITGAEYDFRTSHNKLSEQDIYDICASFQRTVTEILIDRIVNAIQIVDDKMNEKVLVIAGGVAANQYVKEKLTEAVAKYGYRVVTPPIALCTDNAAMTAWVGLERYNKGIFDDLYFEPKSKWSL